MSAASVVALLLLGIDLGTSSVKVLCVTCAGEVVGSGSAEYPVRAPQPGFAEQEAGLWWAAVQRAVRTASTGHADAIAAVGLSGQMHGAVLLDGTGALLGNAIIWPDQRSANQVRELTARVGAGRPIETTGSLTTKPFLCGSAGITVNLDASAGWAKFELLDEAGEPLLDSNGSTRTTTVSGIDATHHPLLWTSGEVEPGTIVRLRTTLHGARLYAFQLSSGTGETER